ncbi:dual specificity protein phosphatase, putative [Pediculus humanus corporis]|uniref:protein-tyrosine-phosphatase n=1 Tax=Pediculus humanus subsp. corporis TaxID=121224 RepID=E0VAX6_PEDHC|nr:dual specificity protein phosphatase, putative [Pediculus humanus corporis]EEB10532.1 dual specificity protein phosphatase, putative [Pediculus humanus corporis]
MPTSDVDEYTSIRDIRITKEWLLQQLRSDSKQIIILDCRSTNEYGESHIRQAVNFSIPSIMLRRLSAGKIDLISTIKCKGLKEKILEGYKRDLFVIYGDDLNDTEKNNNTKEILHVLMKRLKQDGCKVVCLQEGFTKFFNSYPEWCESAADINLPGSDPVATPLMGLRSLRISARSSCGSSAATSSTESSDSDDRCDSSLGLEDDRDFPVEILPHLYLGNAINSEDSESLNKHGIQYILNVTADLPNVFEDCGSMKYMQIPIADHWSENLAKFFPKAIKFIADEGRNNSKGVLVHCLAGVSRSVTITVAYLMYKLKLSLNDAFTLVRNRKSNVGPNFHFMEQLHNFEQELKIQGTLPDVSIHGKKCSKCDCFVLECKCKSSRFLSPLAIGTSPDSGIEFDRWAPPPGSGE